MSGKHRAKCFSTKAVLGRYGDGYSQGKEGGTSLGKASESAMVINATIEHLFNALHLQTGLQTLINLPRVSMRQVLVSPFYRWIKC